MQVWHIENTRHKQSNSQVHFFVCFCAIYCLLYDFCCHYQCNRFLRRIWYPKCLIMCRVELTLLNHSLSVRYICHWSYGVNIYYAWSINCNSTYARWHAGAIGRVSDLWQRLWVRHLTGHQCAKTLGKSCTPMCLCHQAVTIVRSSCNWTDAKDAVREHWTIWTESIWTGPGTSCKQDPRWVDRTVIIHHRLSGTDPLTVSHRGPYSGSNLQFWALS